MKYNVYRTFGQFGEERFVGLISAGEFLCYLEDYDDKFGDSENFFWRFADELDDIQLTQASFDSFINKRLNEGQDWCQATEDLFLTLLKNCRFIDQSIVTIHSVKLHVTEN